LNSERVSSTFQQDSLLTDFSLQNGGGNSWQNSFKNLYSYGFDKFPTQRLDLNWNSSAWDTVAKQQYSFTSSQDYLIPGFSKLGGIYWSERIRTSYPTFGYPDTTILERREEGVWKNHDI